MASRGLDLCYHQGNIDWKKVKADGIDFIIPRDGWGVDCEGKQVDPKFLQNVKEAQEAGIAVPGVYHFIYSINDDETIKNAQNAIANVEKAGLPKSTIIWCDLEYDTVDSAKNYRSVTLTPAEQKHMAELFCDTVLAAGYATGLYVNQDYLRRVYGLDIINKYDVWLADLEGDPFCKCLYRQVNWRGQIAGISTYVDVDEYYGQYTAGTAKPQTTETK